MWDAVLVLEATPAGDSAAEPCIVYVNRAFETITGWTAEQALGRHPVLLRSAVTDDVALNTLSEAMAAGRSAQVELLVRRADGSSLRVQAGVTPLPDDDGTTRHWMAVLRDVTAEHARRETAAASLRASRDLMLSAFDDAPVGMAITTPKGCLLRVNDAAVRMLGAGRDELVGHDLFHRTHPDDLAAALQACSSLNDGAASRSEVSCRLRHADGSWVHTQVTASLVADASGTASHLVMHLQDTTEQVALRAELTRLALHDALTGLPNRTLFTDRLRQALGRSARDGVALGVLYCDVDHFKQINDTYGHAVGDQVLATVAERIVGLLRPGDTAARMGGDEFTVLCEDTDTEEAELVARRLRAAVGRPLVLGDQVLHLSVSVGVAVSAPAAPTDAADRSSIGDPAADAAGETMEAQSRALLRDADIALYLAKERGRARQVTFDPTPRGARQVVPPGR